MATIKSYTDLEQSKKLAEILPLESADMRYSPLGDNMHPWVWTNTLIEKDAIPCWSFVALFNVMPQINDWITPYGHKDDKLSQFEPKICKIWDHSIIPSYKVTYGNGLSTDIYDNPVDAAFEMILKLHELGLL
jgi:hypothetical protein